ncbi:PREDICTED: uncharacterized protein LOC104814668 isoform X2 [Tarenaya hassleriana]|uniref:uncharacterized protein LOC104814668 isoform X2 n=1 Tax=Tarenaya hassleriana TaxID=28532 RepID=UPI0008FD3A12|nr:PREDICTED: uncharacterized protein LOC104814668 isoform X2 [Tarenaya hassleriana]
MGCSQSKLDDEEAVRICKDRKRFIKQAVEQRTKFASGHIAYIQSMKRVSDALREYIEEDEPHKFSFDSFVTPVKKPSPGGGGGFITISPPKLIQAKPGSRMKVNYLMASRTRAVSVEERPPRSPETYRVDAYSPSNQYGDAIFGMNMNSNSSSSFWNGMNSPEEQRPSSHSIPPPSPQQNSQWDFFWNPFSSLDYHGYAYDRSSVDPQTSVDDEIRGLRRVREEEGIPELEDDEDEPDEHERRFVNPHNMEAKQERGKTGLGSCNEEVTVEDVDEDDEEDEDIDDDDGDDAEEEEFTDSGCDCETENDNNNGEGNGTQELRSFEVSRAKSTRHVVGVGSQEVKTVGEGDNAKSETPGYTVYVNRRPTSMAEVIKDLEEQFATVCKAAKDVSGLLEASSAQYSSSTSELSAMKMLNPVALFRSGSSRSSSSRFLISYSAVSKEGGQENTSDLSDESCMLSGSHQSTLDRLYAWEKKLYEEVRSGERVRIAYEKKCRLLMNQDVKGEDPSSVEKTRATIRDLHTRIKVWIHSIEAISKRIETLRDQELMPQLLELVHGYVKILILKKKHFSVMPEINSDVESDGRVSPDSEENLGRSQDVTSRHTF